METNNSRKSWLPVDALSHVFLYLDSPLDLYRASLVGREWRAAAVDPRLWEQYYWAFYRAPASPQGEGDRLLLARRELQRKVELRAWVESIQSSPSSRPPFLSVNPNLEQRPGRLPDFHALFVRRMNNDERLLQDLRAHLDLDCGILNNLLQLVERYGDAARDILFALCGDQQMTRESIGQLAHSSSASMSNIRQQTWPSALAVHKHAASEAPELSLSHCLALHHAAYQLLGHLQRREAVRSIRDLQERFSSPTSTQSQTLKARVLRSSAAVEEALTMLSLFHFGEAKDFSNYLDLLAVYVWAELDADVQNNPNATTTRSSILRIEAVLNRLGFRITGEVDENDLANFFPNVALFCPAQRASSDISFSGILCAVCCRLGVAATPTNTPAWILVVEEGEKPEDWEGLERDWGKFYLLPDRVQRRHRIDTEASVVERDIASTTVQERDGRSPEDYLEPASPLKILHYAAARISNALPADRSASTGYEAPLSSGSSYTPFNDPLAVLRDYFCGRSASPPPPLLDTVPPSSLAMLPPTKANSLRFNSLALRQDARFCGLWIIRLVTPESAGGVEAAEELITDALRECQYLRSDVALLLEVNGCHVRTQIGLTREVLRQARSEDARTSNDIVYVDGPEPPGGVHDLLIDVLKEDMDANRGLDGSGGCEPGTARQQELLNPAHPQNAAVRYGVGTVFTHRHSGYRAVIFGWDSTCRQALPSDRNPQGGRRQPFYHAWADDGSLHYVAQSSIEVARVAQGSTVEQATAQLCQYLRLFKLRRMGLCFQTIEVAPWAKDKDKAKTGGEKKGGDSGQEGEGGEIKMVMNPWMRQAWPFG